MQYVRNISDSVSTAWNSINPATLSGAIDVIVVEQDDGSLMCSPFHVRFGKFSLLRPYEKKVEFKVNGVRQNYSMKLGEGGEAFFVFETTENIPQSMQTSPISSPVSSPSLGPQPPAMSLEPELLALDGEAAGKMRASSLSSTPPGSNMPAFTTQKNGLLTPLSASPEFHATRPKSGDWSWTQRTQSDDVLRKSGRRSSTNVDPRDSTDDDNSRQSDRSHSPPPPPVAGREAFDRAMLLSRELSTVNIPSRVTESGDLMLDMTGFKDSEENAIRAEVLARRVLSNELQGNYDIGALFGMDEQGNLWIYSSEEAKEAAMKHVMEASMAGNTGGDGSGAVRNNSVDAASDPGYHSDDSAQSAPPGIMSAHRRSESDVGQRMPNNQNTPPSSPGPVAPVGDPNRNYAKTLRLTSDQLKALNLKLGENTMSFTVNRATCSAYMYLWKHEIPVVISDIDGTITKSDALGHVLNMIGRDWTHAGVAKLYSDIAANGYNIMYLTSRSVGLADGTRTYLHGISQDGYKLPRGPTILSPDRTMAALRREIYLRKPEVFKMATLRDIRNLYGVNSQPFYAGFGNRLTDQISYRTVDVPRNRIFTINANAEVSLDLLSLNQMKLTYVNITEVVDHYFPPVSTLVKGGGEEYTDFKYWRDDPLDMADFSDSESEDETPAAAPAGRGRRQTPQVQGDLIQDDDDEEDDEEDDEDDEDDDELDEEDEEEVGEGMADSYIEGSVLSGDYEDGPMTQSMIVDDEEEEETEEETEEEETEGETEETDDEDVPRPNPNSSSSSHGHNHSNSQTTTTSSSSALGSRLNVSTSNGTNASGTRVTRVTSRVSNATVEDVGAELITGVKNLSMDATAKSREMDDDSTDEEVD